MSNTTSLAWPNMFDIARNRVNVNSDSDAVTNRARLLISTDPTELFNNLDQGVGIRQYLWAYNNANTVAILQTNIRSQLDAHEPYVTAANTTFTDTLISDDNDSSYDPSNSKIKMTVAMETTFGATATTEIS